MLKPNGAQVNYTLTQMDLKKTKWSAPFKNSLARTLAIAMYTETNYKDDKLSHEITQRRGFKERKIVVGFGRIEDTGRIPSWVLTEGIR